MLCKLLTCEYDAEERRITPYGTANLCVPHATHYDRWKPSTEKPDDHTRHTLDELRLAFRYGPVEDPPLEQDARGADYAHPRTGAE